MKLSMDELIVLVNYYSTKRVSAQFEEWASLRDKKLLTVEDNHIVITQKGIDLVNNLLKTTELLLTET